MTALINSLGKLFSVSWNYSRALWDWGVRTTVEAAGKILNLPPWVQTGLAYLFAAVTVVLGAIKQTGEFVVEMVGLVLGPVASLNAGTYNAGSLAADVLRGINTFFPLDKLFAFLTVHFALVLACAVIRMIKAWIPTLS